MYFKQIQTPKENDDLTLFNLNDMNAEIKTFTCHKYEKLEIKPLPVIVEITCIENRFCWPARNRMT